MKIPNLFELNAQAKKDLTEMDNLTHELGEFESMLAQIYADYLEKALRFDNCPEASKEQIKKLLKGVKTIDN